MKARAPKSGFGLCILLICCMVPVAASAQQQTADQPSLGELARKVRAERARQDLGNVPLYTNDNLPNSSSGLGVIGAANSAGKAGKVNSIVAKEKATARQKLAELRYSLSEATKRFELHQQELTVLEQQLGQNNLQYYPDPSKILTQEYSRSDINKLISQINEKKAQVADDQQSVSRLQSEFQAGEARWGWLLTGPVGKLPAPAEPPIRATPGTPAYYHAKLELLRQKLSTAKEEEKLAENQVKLLKVQQIQTLDPNLRAELSTAMSAKQSDLDAAQQNLQQTERLMDGLEEKLRRAEGDTRLPPPAPDSQPLPQQ